MNNILLKIHEFISFPMKELLRATAVVFLLSFIVIVAACERNELYMVVSTMKDTDATITSFSFSTPPAAGVITGTGISVKVPWDTNVTALAPTIVYKGASMMPASGTAQDFTSPVIYKVTAADSSFVNYTVTVTKIEYSIGDTGPAGGLIFYINPDYAADGWKYLEAAPDSSEWTGIKWSALTPVTTNTSIGTLLGIGDGEGNSAAIVAALTGQTSIAAYLCDNLSISNDGKSFDDWFLPSYQELQLAYSNLKAASLGNFSAADYWSSSEETNQTAYVVRFTTGIQVWQYKDGPYYVRAIRAF